MNQVALLRKGFYCYLCNSEKQKEISNNVFIVEAFIGNTVKFSIDFCKELVESTIEASYLIVQTLIPYLSNSVNVMTCNGAVGDTSMLGFEFGFAEKLKI